MLMADALAGVAIGAALMIAARNLPFGIFLVPISVAIGPLFIAMRGRRPSRTFLALYVVAAALLFTLMALMSPGWQDNFDPP
jgi:hypothetical protein